LQNVEAISAFVRWFSRVAPPPKRFHADFPGCQLLHRETSVSSDRDVRFGQLKSAEQQSRFMRRRARDLFDAPVEQVPRSAIGRGCQFSGPDLFI